MITLFHTPGSCSLVVKAVLNTIGIEYQEKRVDLANKSTEFLARSPLGKVPALMVENEVLLEGGAIVSWLADKHPEANLMPPTGTLENAKAKRWLFYMYSTMHPTWSMLFAPERYSNDVTSTRDKAEQLLNSYMELVAAQLQDTPYLAGDTPTLADYFLAVSLNWEGMLQRPFTEKYPQLATHRESMLTLPGLKAAFDADFPKSV